MRIGVCACIAAACIVGMQAGNCRGAEGMKIRVESSAFAEGDAIPAKYALANENISPPVRWSGLPQGAKSIVLICDDPDAPRGVWAHWVIFNIPAESGGLPEGLSDDATLPDGSVQGVNDFGNIGWDGPAPPKGTHHYIFRVYALDATLSLEPGLSRSDLIAAMRGHILAKGELTGIYSRE